MENIKDQNAEDIDISASINKNLDIPLLIKKKLHLRDLRRKNKDLSVKHADIKKVLHEKENYFSFKEKVHNESREKLIKEYQMATKDNYDRQVILEEKIKNKEKKIKMYDLEISKFKVAIADMHERIKEADYDMIESKKRLSRLAKENIKGEKCLSFLSKLKENSAEFVQLDIFDRLETIFSSREFIKKKKESLKAKINIIKARIKDTEEKYNLALMDKEKEYKNLVETSESVLKKEKEIAEQLKEKINEHNKNALLLYKIISCVDNFLNRFSSFLPELRHYNVKKDEEKSKLEKKNKPQNIMEDTQFIDTADFSNLEEDILRKLDVIYKYIKDTIYIINKAKKEISLKDDNYMESMKNNFGKPEKTKSYRPEGSSAPALILDHDNIEFLTYNNIKGKNN